MDASLQVMINDTTLAQRCRDGGVHPINLGSHKSAAVRQLIQAANARLWYLPPYSPDLNPIEQAFAKIKHWMRAPETRTIEDTWRHIGRLVATIKPHECNNYFVNAGYASVKT
jgi:putative transposase